MKKIFLLVILHSVVFGQSNIKVGQKAPQITITDWILNVPKDKNLTNKYLVLEFWATWCGPCIAAVPHMNDLQAKFNDPNLYFISITDEPKEKVERTLKRIDFQSIVVSDQNKNTQIQFGDGKEKLETYPLTVLIDPKGLIYWIGSPKELSEGIMQDFLKGKKFEAKADVTTQEAPKNEIVTEKGGFMELITNSDILYKFDFRKSKLKNQSISKGGQKLLSYTATSFIDLYADLMGHPKKNILMPDSIRHVKCDLTYKNLKGNGQNLVDIESQILKTLGLKKSVSTQKLLVHEVSIFDTKLLEKALDESFSAKSEAKDKLIFTSFTISGLIKELNGVSTLRLSTNHPDESKYDFIIEVNSPESIIKSLESYGFEIRKTEKEIEIWQLDFE